MLLCDLMLAMLPRSLTSAAGKSAIVPAVVSPAAKPIRMVTDPRPVKAVPLPSEGSMLTAAGQRHTQGSVPHAAAGLKGAEAAPKGGGIGRHRLPEAEPKLEEPKVPAKGCCGGCSIM